MEEMVMLEETTAVEATEVTELADLARVDCEVSGEVVDAADNGGINPIVAAGVGLGVTGIVGGLTYMFLKKRKNKKAKNDKKEEVKEAAKTAEPTTEKELTEYLEKLLAETAEVNNRIMELKKKTEENEEEILDEDI